MITGAHCIIYSTNSQADKAFFKEVLHLPDVDAGEGWLIFGLPPAEIAIHPDEHGDRHEIYLQCNDIDQFMQLMAERNVHCTAPQNQTWGRLSYITLPGGGTLGVYEPQHERPQTVR